MMGIPMLAWNGNVNVSVETNLIQDLFGAGRINAMKGAQATQIKIVEELMQSVFGKFRNGILMVFASSILQFIRMS